MLFNDRFNSNWDLSAARAAVADFLLDEFPANPASMTISGFADSKPIADNGTPRVARKTVASRSSSNPARATGIELAPFPLKPSLRGSPRGL